VRQGGSIADVAVFYRTNAQSRVVEDAMVTDAIPYHMVGGMRFYERLEIKDILAYLKILVNPADEVALKRIINVPPRGIGHATVDKISEQAARQGLTFYEALRAASGSGLLASGPRGKIAAFAELVERFRGMAATLSLSELASRIIQDTGYAVRLQEERSEESMDRLANLQEMVSALEEFERASEEKTLAAFLEQVALISDLERTDQGRESVTLMTLHAAKGLEFPLVFMIGMEERIFPHVRALDDPEQMEEERRLCYVGMTRAKERLVVSNARRRRIFGQDQFNQPSRFIAEIPREFLDVEGEYFAFGTRGLGTRDQGPVTGYQGPGIPASATPLAHNLATVFTQEPESEFANEVQVVPEDTGEVQIGMRVRHGKFGVGTIRKIEGRGDDQKVIVWFKSVGPKKLLVRFAGLERV
jgi:DNA helicase-2/ATP-dependent DNA helicase PcrA